jgi:hypothetical protein
MTVTRKLKTVLATMSLVAGLTGSILLTTASQAAGPTALNLRILLIGGPGGGAADSTTAAWAATLSSEGVPYTEIDATGSYGAEALTVPALTSGTTGLFDGVVIADSPSAFAAGALASVFSYESTYGVRQVDGYGFPNPALGLSWIGAPDSANPAALGNDPSNEAGISSTTAALTTAGLATFPSLKGPVPVDPFTYAYPATVTTPLPTGASETPLLDDAAGNVLVGLFQHPSATDAPADPQAGVAELSIGFNYNQYQLQWLILGPALVDWVSGGTHLGLYRNYIGEDVDDVFIADNEWSATYQCTPAASDPPDYTCPAGVANNPADEPADVEMGSADVDAVASWEAANNFTLELAFNGVGACTAQATTSESGANCTGSATVGGTTYTDPGQAIDPSTTNDSAFVNELLAKQGDFDWITHTWSHQFLGCEVWMPQATTAITAGSAGTLAAGGYAYVVTAATAYGESEPSLPLSTTVGANGSVTLTWPDATNGTGTAGNPGPTLATLESEFSGGTGFWGYDIYRGTSAAGPFGLVGQVAENGSTPAYSFTDTGAATPGAEPGSSDTFPTATDPGIDCSSAPNSWDPASSATPDASIDQEIGLDDAFAANNGLTNFSPAAVVTGEHSGLENPDMATAFADMGITTFAADGSRQPNPYTISGTDGANSTTAKSAPRYPSNIYYNASTWADEINEYNTLYATTTTAIGNGGPGGATEYGRCADTSSTTCITTPATQASILASESRIEMGHVLANNPRVGYAHQSDLIGPDYTLLSFLSDVLSQYNSWYSAATPYVQTTDAIQAGIISEQSAWATALANGTVTATESNGAVTVTNNGAGAVSVPVTVPTASTVNGLAFGSPYGGTASGWETLGGGATLTVATVPVVATTPTITSGSSATAMVGTPFTFTVTTSGVPTPTLSESGAMPGGITFTDNGNGTATIAGTPAVGSGGTASLTITAGNSAGSATQTFVLSVQAAAISMTESVAPASFAGTGVALGYSFVLTNSGNVALTGVGVTDSLAGMSAVSCPSATLAAAATETCAAGYTTTAADVTAGHVGDSATASGTSPAATVVTAPSSAIVPLLVPPTITSPATASVPVLSAMSFTFTATGTPTPTITLAGTLPKGVTFTSGAGTATLAGTPSLLSFGSYPLTVTATSAAGTVTQKFMLTVTLMASAPSFSSAASTTAAPGAAFSFAITTNGSPTPTLTETGALPQGVSFVNNGNGTATLTGGATTAGTYPLTLTATNSRGKATQAFKLVVGSAPAITSPNAGSGQAGQALAISITTTGSPTPTLTRTGTLPGGVTFTTTNGTATLAGVPTKSGVFKITVTATSAAGKATQAFTLTVTQAPAITSSASMTVRVGQRTSFTVRTSGYPTPALTQSGLPAGLTFTDNHNGTATVTGTLTTAGSRSVTLSATNGVNPTASQKLTITAR